MVQLKSIGRFSLRMGQTFSEPGKKERKSVCVLSLCVCLSGINASTHSRQTQWVKCEKCLNSHLSPEENIMYSEKKEDWRRTESGATFSRRLVLHTHSAARHYVLMGLLAAGQQRTQNCSDLKETQRIMEEANDLWKLKGEKQNKALETWCAQLLWLQSREMSCRFSPFFAKGLWRSVKQQIWRFPALGNTIQTAFWPHKSRKFP